MQAWSTGWGGMCARVSPEETQKNRGRGRAQPHCTSHSKAAVPTTAWSRQKERGTGQWSKKDSPEPDTGATGKGKPFQPMVLEQLVIFTEKQ